MVVDTIPQLGLDFDVKSRKNSEYVQLFAAFIR